MRLRKDAKVDLISRVPLFTGCSKRELGLIANLADLIELPEGKTLTKEVRPVGSSSFWSTAPHGCPKAGGSIAT